MGIRFRCHHCESELHVKDFQAGRRGRCPECKGRFRIPLADAEHSLAVESSVPSAEDSRAESELALAPDSNDSEVSSVIASGTESGVSKEDAVASSTSTAPPPVDLELSQPQVLTANPNAQWLVRPATGGEFGPAPSNAMWQWLKEHRIGSDSLIWCEGWSEWQAAADVFPDFFSVSERASSIEPAQPSASNPLVAAVSTPAVPTESVATDASRMRRRKKRSRNYAVTIAVLSVLMIVLVLALAIVLLRQN